MHIKILFFGTSNFAVPILQKLIDEKYNIAAVVTQPDKPTGRKQTLTPSPIKILAAKLGIPLLQPEKLRDNFKILTLNFQLIITASYGKIIPKKILDLPKFGALNVHPSLLPKYRGSSPIQNAILNGDKKTGVTIMMMDEKMDHGPILAQEEKNIDEKQNFDRLHDELSKLGAELLIKTIPQWISCDIKPTPQGYVAGTANRAVYPTYTKIIKKEDGKIDWTKSAIEIERQIRAFTHWPGCWTIYKMDGKEKRVKIIEAVLGTKRLSHLIKPGQIFKTENKKMTVKCGKDFLEIKKLQIEGKKEMSGEDFLRGYSKLFLEGLPQNFMLK
ncbi:MAG: methionyl-tRNA formyltransferase [bacterium]